MRKTSETHIIRYKTVKVEDDVDSPQAELVAEVTNILDTLQVNSKFQLHILIYDHI